MNLGPNQTLSASANYYYDIYQYPDSIESIPIFLSGGAGLDAFFTCTTYFHLSIRMN